MTIDTATIIDVPALLIEPPSPEALAAGRAAAEKLIYETDWSIDLPQPTADSVSIRPNGRIVTVYSPKGGAGTTFVAVNLAVALADTGHRVCLVDLDLQFGDVAIMTRTSPVRGVLDAVGVQLTETELAEIVTPFDTGDGTSIDCVLAPVDPAAGDAVTADVVRLLLTRLRECYDHVVVDTAAHLSEHTLEALDAADQQVLVTTPDISSIKNTRLLLDTLDLLGTPAQRRLVVLNQSSPKDRAVAGTVAEALRYGVTATVPRSAEVGTSAELGTPLIRRMPKDPAAASLHALVVGHLAVAAPAAPKRGLHRNLIPRRNRGKAAS